MSRVSESLIGDEFSDPMEYMDQPLRKANRKSSLINKYDDDDNDEEDDEDKDDDEEEEFEEEDDDDE